MKFKNKKYKIISMASFMFILIFIFLLYQADISKTVAQTSTSNLSGYAWSSTIGWISMSGTGYGVELNSNDQTLSGYAWSPIIGWIQFGELTTGFPSGPGTISADAKYDTVNNKLTGWVKANAADNNGWDGWISLSGTGYGIDVNSTNGNFSGWAWGSDVVGWIDFSGVVGGMVSNDGVCAIFPTGSSQPNSLPVIGNLCNPGMATTPTEATTTDTSIPANSTDVDYYYTWTCNSLSGGNSSPLCEVTTESKDFTDGQIQSIVARLTPSIVKTKDDPCTVLWTTPSDMVCYVEKAGSVHTDFNNTTDGHQVEVGDNYQVVCKDSATQNIITAKSQILKCALNPSVREI